MKEEKKNPNIKINLSNIYTEKELDQMKKLIPNLSSLIFIPSQKSLTTLNSSSRKTTKLNQYIEKDKFVKIILEQILNKFKVEENQILSKSLYYFLNDKNNDKSSKTIINRRNSDATYLKEKNHIFINLAEKPKIKGDNIFKQKRSPNKKNLIDKICNTEISLFQRKTIDFHTSKKHNKLYNNLKINNNSGYNLTQSKRDKKIIDYKENEDKTDYNVKNLIKDSNIKTSLTFCKNHPGIISSQIKLTDFPNISGSSNRRKSDTSESYINSQSNQKPNRIYFQNQFIFQNNSNNKSSLKRRLSPFSLGFNKSYEENKYKKVIKKFEIKIKHTKINPNHSNDNIKKLEKLKTEMNKEKINPINRYSVQQFNKIKDITLMKKNNKNINKKVTYKQKNVNPKSNLDKKELIININIIYNDSIESKDFDIFNLEKEVGNENILPLIGTFIYKRFDFSKIIQYQKFINWSKKIAQGYLRTNPYHNDRHGADVTQTCFLYLLQEGVQQISKVNNIDICSLILSCICHDFKHPGVNNNFLRLTKDKLAIRYNDISILENMHVSQSFKLMNKYPECDIFSGVEYTIYEKMRKKMISCVLCTDMANHSKHINFMKNIIEKKDKKDDKNNDNQEYMNLLIHSADISNPTKPFNIYLKWAKLVLEEFFIQGDKEKALGLVCTCDRKKVKLNNNQIGFIDYVVKEFVSLNIQVFPSLKFCYDNLIDNREKFVNYKEDKEINSNKKIKMMVNE